MKVFSKNITLKTKGEIDIVDLTWEVRKILRDSGLKDGLLTVFNVGSTAAITTIEYDPPLLEDFKDAIRRIVSRDVSYRHPGNAHSHCRASLLGPSVTIPFRDGELLLGTWQQIVLVEFDTRPRVRNVIVQIVGD
ncbi:MAG: secondary thiamine-phosphate synthase enzyme YjbQ [Candidatus Asgardarchaeia archaeon]